MHSSKSIRRSIKNELLRQGLQATPREIVSALTSYGIQVDEDAVQRVKVELLKDRSGIQQAKGLRKKPSSQQKRPQKIPERRPGKN